MIVMKAFIEKWAMRLKGLPLLFGSEGLKWSLLLRLGGA
jgi:hypothetical protein